jgi:hypothetical protein
MDDGSEDVFDAGDVMQPPGHDAWAVRDEPCTFGGPDSGK